MKFRLLLIGTLLLAACAPAATDRGGNGATDRTRNGMMQGSFLPAQDADIDRLPEAKPASVLTVKDGDTITLNPELVRASFNGKNIALYAYNGQFPGPTLKVQQGSTFTVNVKNNIDVPTTIHWHGIRLKNAFDGAEGVTQEAIEPGESFTYTVTVPDEGMFWYHPHVREDLQQDMGLYGNLWVTPDDATAYNPVNREEIVMLDDILLEGGLPVPYGKQEADHALMGRFGNTMLINGSAALTTGGKTAYDLTVKRGEVVRFTLTNAANTRPFALRFGNAAMKIVGGDAGRTEKEEFTDTIVLSPSERAIVEVLFETAGTETLEHRGLEEPVALGAIRVQDSDASPSYASSFLQLRRYDDVAASIDEARPFFDKPVDKTLRLSVESMPARMMGGAGAMQHGGGHGGSTAFTERDGVEWEDPMPQVNAMSSKHNTKWKLIDEASAAENMDIAYRFTVGDKVKIRIINDTADDGSDHPMQHPIHFHGQRFLVLAVDGTPTENLGWKDTVLVPTGKSVDILLDVANPGDWMFHCHIAEHLSNGMMGVMKVDTYAE